MKAKKTKITDAFLLQEASNVCKDRAGYRCEVADCNYRYSRVEAHHWYSRRHASLRYDPNNLICLCPSHHTLSPFSAHNDPDFKDRLIATGVRTRDWEEKLRGKRNLVVKNNQTFKDAAYENLKKWGCE